MLRFFDFTISLIGILVFFPIFIIIWVIGFLDTGSPLFIQHRIGRNQKLFLLIKFRTMHIDTKSSATHLVDQSKITPFGHFLRYTKLDEIPQLLNVLFGDMSLVGPRPCLSNQKKLINERKKKGVFKVKPGITGLAQVTGINMKTPTLLAKTDLIMIKKMNLYLYFYYILKTLLMIIKSK